MIDAVVFDRGKWATSTASFAPVRLNDYAGEEEPTEAMERQLESTLETVAGFLERRAVEVFEGFAERGLDVYLFIDVWMDQNQMELTLPASLLKSCGRHGLRIEMMSNDISVAELLADGAT